MKPRKNKPSKNIQREILKLNHEGSEKKFLKQKYFSSRGTLEAEILKIQ